MRRHWNRLLRAASTSSLEVFSHTGWGFEQPGLVKDVPVHAGGLD